ncbi:MAG: Glu-tRNA(Gln) amidotransferase subunit GatD [Candidatus Nanoarchaeia archaeon]
MRKFNAKEGDAVEIQTDSEKVSGILMPSKNPSTIILKQGSGYNTSFNVAQIKSFKVIKKQEKRVEKKKQPLKFKKDLPTISILHTGGTIASAVDYKTGAVVAKFSPEDLIAMFPELGKIANIKSRLIRNMMSDDMRFAHYNLMAKEIEKEIKSGVDGVIITHGTDTLHYSSAALDFIFEELPIPVVLVGAQRSSDRGSSDAFVNIITAAYFITKTDFAGIAICMHESISDTTCLILPATKTRKMHTSRRDAFRPINTKPWARVNYDNGNVEFLNKDYKKREKKKPVLKLFKPNLKVGILKIHPNMYASEVENYKGFDGLVLEGTGLGHAPISVIDEFTKEHKKIFAAIKNLSFKGTVVVMSPQTIYGQLQMNVYSPGREIQEAGVIGNYCDMTPETAFIKLAWLLSNYPKHKVKELFVQDLRGEISKKISADEFLI